MDSNSSRSFLRDILPKVSRTFAINIRILQGQEYDFIGTCYLICRFIDTIEDSPTLSNKKKIDLLKKFSQVFSTDQILPENFFPLIKKCQNISSHTYENELVSRFDKVILLYTSLPKLYQKISKDMIIEMALGMADFIKRYAQHDRKIFRNIEELEKYCYYVAGTVGIILTRFFSLKISSIEKKKVLEKYTNDFGLALQMTNIIKDFNDDKKRGWVYIPLTVLKEANVSVDDFYQEINLEQVKAIQEILIRKIEIFIKNSLKYCLNIPSKLIKYRLFCLIPLFLSIKTIFFLKNRKIDQINIKKISKRRVFITILIVYLICPFNFLIKTYYLILKKIL